MVTIRGKPAIIAQKNMKKSPNILIRKDISHTHTHTNTHRKTHTHKDSRIRKKEQDSQRIMGKMAIVNPCCSVAKSCPTWRPHGLQHARLPCPSLSPRVCSNS